MSQGSRPEGSPSDREGEREDRDDAFAPNPERVWDPAVSETERIRTVYREMGALGIRRTIESVRNRCLDQNVWPDESWESLLFEHLNRAVVMALPDKRTKKPTCEAALLRLRIELADRAFALMESGDVEGMRRAVAEYRASGKR